MTKYKVIGIMSGTSLDGIDLAYCEFSLRDDRWEFELLQADTIPYDRSWSGLLSGLISGSAEKISEADFLYGQLLGREAKTFCEKHGLQPDFISSHGHTVFHQPGRGFTRQIGSGAAISAAFGLPVVCDFRSKDVALGGQGAPLVPLGDKILFGGYDFCLNLGGIANISFDEHGSRIAGDVCPCNIVLNHYAEKLGHPYDKDGTLADSGKINEALLTSLNKWKYYKRSFPKSIGREEIEREIFPVLEASNLKTEDMLSTFCEHISNQVAEVINNSNKKGKGLLTGGGAFNKYLVRKIQNASKIEITLPSERIINYKEAIIFAFLGVLRIRKEINCLKSVTGARTDSCSGAIYE